MNFVPAIGRFELSMYPRDFQQNEGQIYPKTYPTIYHLVAISPRSIISGMVSNSSFGSILAKSMGIRDAANRFPGKLEFIDIVSRTLENKDGSEV